MVHALKKRDRAPGRSGRPLANPITTRLSREDTARVKAYCRERGISCNRFLGDLIRTALAGIEIDVHSRSEIFPAPDHLPGAGYAPKIDHERRREREEVEARKKASADMIRGHDLPTDIF